MQVLVTAASKHGATGRIAHAIAERLTDHGYSVLELEPQDVTGLDGVDAVVLGSGVYAGHWLREARNFAHAHTDELRTRPVWLFSSGPVGDPPVPAEEAHDGLELADYLGARGHRTFGGKIDRHDLNFAERTVMRAVRAPEGDYRDWDAIGKWADKIAAELSLVSSSV